jgi:hypothetical protein
MVVKPVDDAGFALDRESGLSPTIDPVPRSPSGCGDHPRSEEDFSEIQDARRDETAETR